MMMGVYKMSSSVNSSGCILSFTTYLANVEIDSSLFKLLNNFFEAVTRAQKLISELFLLQKWRSRGALNRNFFVYKMNQRVVSCTFFSEQMVFLFFGFHKIFLLSSCYFFL